MKGKCMIAGGSNKSMLEQCVELLYVLSNFDSVDFLSVQGVVGIGDKRLLEVLLFLESQRLIRKGLRGKQMVYFATPRGIRVSRFFKSRAVASKMGMEISAKKTGQGAVCVDGIIQ